MGTTIGNKDIVTTGSGHTTMTPPAVSLNPPTPPAGPVPVPYPYTARSATASATESALEAGGSPVVVKGSILDVDPPANQPSQPTGGDVVTHAVKGKVNVTEGSSNTKANGKGVSATGDGTCVNVLTGHEQVAQESHMPLLKAGGADMAGDEDGEGAEGGKKGKSAVPAAQAKCESDPVDVATGRVIDEAVDLALPGILPLVWKRSYSSALARERGALGRGGWSHSFEQWVVEGDEATTLRAEDGRDLYFARVAPGESAFLRSERLTLAADRSGGFTVTDHATRLSRVFAPLARGERAVLRAVRDVYGHAVALEYAGADLVRIVDTAGREIRIENDDRGRVRRVEVRASAPPPATPEPGAPRAAPPRIEVWFDYAYGAGGELEGATDALGHAERYAYDGLHRMVKKTLKNGVSFHYVYDDETGWCVLARGDGGLHTVALKPDLEKKTTSTSGSHEPRVYTWNEDGLVVREETLDGNFVREREYDADRYLLCEANAAGEKTSYAYDERGNLIKAVDAAGNETLTEYAEDRPRRRVAPGELVTTFTHDDRGALVGVAYPSGLAYSLTHDADGRLTGVHGADGALFACGYDDQHNWAFDRDARGAHTRYAYDALGNPTARTDAIGRTTRVGYDRLGQAVTATFPDGTSTRTEYDPLGNVARFTDGLGQVTRLEHAGTGVLAQLTQADGQIWRFSYDDDERLTCIHNPRAERYAFAYDAAGRIERERTFDGRVLEYQRDKAGRVARVAYPDSGWRELAYDPLGNVVEDRSPDGSVVFERNALGHVVKASLTEHGGKVVTELQRDALGRVVVEKQNGRAVGLTYDALGRLASRTLPGGQRTTYHHDAVGALVGVEHAGHRVAVERDVLGRETRKHVYQGKVDIQRTYDAMDRLAEQRVSAPAEAGGGAVAELARRRWAYDANGRVRQLDDKVWGGARYAYDAIGHLLEATRGQLHEVFEYDPTGSLYNVLGRLSQAERAPTWEVGPGNVLVRTPGAEYANDARGRRTRKIVRVQGADGAAREEVTTYGWDSRDRLREVVLPDGRRALYTYDAFGRRVQKEIIPAARRDFRAGVDLALAHGKDALEKSRVVELLWHGDVLAAELDSARGERVFVHEPGTFLPLLQEEQGAVFTYVNDHVGAPLELVDGDGRVAWSALHSAWGRVLDVRRDPKARRAVESPFRLLGQYYDEETGLCYVRFRYFDAALGRWCSADPLGIAGGMNLFGFDGSPTTSVDAFGLACGVIHVKDFDTARKLAFKLAGMEDPELVKPTKFDPETGTYVEFKGPGGAKVAYDSPHESPGPGHDKPHVGWQTAGKGADQQSGNITYDGPQHPYRSPEKGTGVIPPD